MSIDCPLINESSDDDHHKNRRRSKNDNEGRTYKCDTCGKAYLSYPALYTHIKTKHDLSGNKGNKGRGRPKKDNCSPENTMRMLYNPLSFDYFKHPDRIGETPIEELESIFEEIFKEVFITIRNKNEHTLSHIRPYNNKDEYILFNKIIECYNVFNSYQSSANRTMNGTNFFLNNNNNLDENSKCDDIIAYYLFKVAKSAKSDCFKNVLKFVILFRECLNYIYKDASTKNSTNSTSAETNSANNNLFEYSAEFPAEDVPDISNEFILEFLQTNDQTMGYNKEEAIDLTQNLCQWLYDNNFTCSKLSLINNS